MMNASLQLEAATAPNDSARRFAGNMGSTYVPLESWVYPAIERLAVAGYVQSAFESLRPWTRLDCARLVEEAEELSARGNEDENADAILKSLHQEFRTELQRLDGASNREARVESVDHTTSSIGGRPLTDGYHFGQTIVNNYGRSYGQGLNTYTGAAVRITAGPLAAYIRAELQQSAGGPVLPGALAREAIALADFTPTAADGPAAGYLRGRLLDTNASFTYRNNQLTFGKQSLWWGPGRGGALLLSNNAEPLTMLRYDRVRPFKLPSFLGLLGPVRGQFFIGRLEGQQFVHAGSSTLGMSGVALKDQPFLHGEKVSFKPTPNFEFSVSRTGIFAGTGSPFNSTTFARSLFSTGNGTGSKDPGDRRSAFDASYRLPGLRNCLTAYVDTFTDDEPFPLVYPTESAWAPGFLLSCVPHARHLTLRAEGQLTPHRDIFPGFYYFNVHYLSGYTNNRQLIGSWIGREGQGSQVWGTWWLSPRSSIEASVRTMNASSEFLRGGTLRDLAVAADLALRPDWQLKLSTQVERWDFSFLTAAPVYNATTTVQISYRPQSRAR